MFHIGGQFASSGQHNKSTPAVFLDSQFVALLSKNYAKFSKLVRKELYKFNNSLPEMFGDKSILCEAERFYFPFNLDKKHWIGVCVDCSNWTVLVLDCNLSLRTDYMMTKEMKPIAQMFPHLLRQAGKQLMHKDGRPFTIERPRTLPQDRQALDSALFAVLFIEAHAAAGIEVCKSISPEGLSTEVERLAVSMCEASCALL